MMQKFKITNSQESVIIDIEGTIGVPEQWQFEEPQQRVATYETFRQTLQQIEQLDSPKVVVNIRSTGGDVNDALLIYDALKSLNASITTRCYGYVASAATVIAQAASEGMREISPNALYLVHNSQCTAEGCAEELLSRVELLRKTDESLAELYAKRSGREVAEFSALMSEQSGAGRWLTAQETIELGLADVLIESSQSAAEIVPAEVEESLMERALKQVSNVVSRIGERLKTRTAEPKNREKREETQQVEKPDTEPIIAERKREVVSRSKASQIALEEGQKSLTKSEVKRVEDPTLSEVKRSANYEAYDRDAKQLKR